ncbi:MAG: hypothetical protein A2033_01390 [Bacteroidetes bacterium GWA2_31_9]|nr:MAG: hypothetical protein A2033_01390 [Bacteroidetes bacterium GWA2_31_9]
MTDNKDIEKLIFDSLENLSVTPTETVKKRIDKTMFFQNMIHFHAVKLIIGTSLFTVITGVVLYFSLLNNSSVDLQSSNIQNSKIVEKATVLINNEPSTENEFSTEQNTNILEDSKEKKIASYISTRLNDHLAMTETDKTQTTEKVKLSNINSSKNKKVNSDNIVSNSENNSVKITENKSNASIAKANITKNEISTEINLNTLNNQKEISSYISTRLNDHLAMTKNSEVNNSFNRTETSLNSEIYYSKMLSLPFEQIPFETETYNMNLLAIDSALLKEYLKAQNRWFLDIFWMPSLSSTFYKTDNIEFEKLIEQKNNAVQNSLSYNSFGISGGFFKNNIMFKVGLGYTNIADNYNFSLILNNPSEKTNLIFNNNHYDFEQNGTYYNIDTVGGYYHYTYVQDSIIHLYDSSWVDITDSSTVNMYDSIRFIQYDSLKNKEYLNNYTYFEIPLSFGYRFQYNNFEITPEFGIITGYLYKKEGINISNDLQNNETYIRTFPYKLFIISGTVAININYNISENLGIFIEPAYRQTIASFFNSSSTIKGNSKTFVIKFGIRKKF